MDKKNMKNMVVLKDLPSNIIEEAIVILKPNIKLKSLDLAKNKKDNRSKKNKDNSKSYVINEAQMIISNYLSKMEDKKNNEIKLNKKIVSKYKIAKAISILLGILLALSFFR